MSPNSIGASFSGTACEGAVPGVRVPAGPGADPRSGTGTSAGASFNSGCGNAVSASAVCPSARAGASADRIATISRDGRRFIWE